MRAPLLTLTSSALMIGSQFIASQAHADFFRANEPGIRVGLGGGQFAAEIQEDSHAVAWNVFIGYEFNQYFAAEAGWIGGGESFAGNGKVITGGTSVDTVGNRFWNASLLGSWPFDNTLSVFIRAGMMQWSGDTLTTRITSDTKTAISGTEPIYGLGAAITLDDGMLRLEYDRTEILGEPATYIALTAAWKIKF